MRGKIGKKKKEEEKQETIRVEQLEASLYKSLTEVINGLCCDGVALFDLGDRHSGVGVGLLRRRSEKLEREREREMFRGEGSS